ncbi:hypothetical protein CI610_03718 [invertebrate metagenome]|uniref:Uncharacterized protein n=1 Tax=invertebrate metagenome TaxID=1711999 RepID=A0A2H9T2B6_9ZZZZ
MYGRTFPDSNKRERSLTLSSTPSPILRSAKKGRLQSDSIPDISTSTPMADVSSTESNVPSHNALTAPPSGVPQQLYSQILSQGNPQMVPMFQNFNPLQPTPGYGHTSTGISDHDVQRIASAVRNLLLDDINTIVDKHINPIVNRLTTLEAENTELRLKLDDLEQYGRRSLVRFSGLPENENENTTNLVLDAVTACGIDLTSDDIERSHRVGKPGKGKPRQIIMRLKSVDTKFKLLKSSREFRNNPTYRNISVNEDLTKYRNELAFFARKLAKNRLILQTWTTNGKVMVKDKSSKIYQIRAEGDLVPFGHVMDVPNDLHP